MSYSFIKQRLDQGKIIILDGGIGAELEKNGANVDVIKSFDQSKNYDGLLLPGVGNFDPAIRSIRDYSAIDFNEFVKNQLPVLGICLGMEMFFKTSQEGKEKGLDIMNGEVVLLPNDMKIPHMGWNSLEITKESKILEGVNNESWVYFVHSYRAKPDNQDIIVANADYGIKVPAVVEDKLFFGTQFHPEKSGKVGSLMIQNFLKVCRK